MKEKIELNSNAITLRNKLGEDPFSPINVFSIISNIDCFTLVFYPMSEKISGMCVRINEQDRLIAINSTMSYGRQRFTAAHELYHLYFQENFISVICPKDIETSRDVEEKNADVFASYFLAPYDALKMFIRNGLLRENKPLNDSDVVKIEQYFGMSRQATLIRLQAEGYISTELSNSMKTNIIQSAKKLGYDNKLYVPTPVERQQFTLGSYILMVEILKEKGIISEGKFEEYLLDSFRSDIVYNLDDQGEGNYD